MSVTEVHQISPPSVQASLCELTRSLSAQVQVALPESTMRAVQAATHHMNYPEIQHKTFLILLVAFSLAFVAILLPFYGAVFWAIVLAILFSPFYRKLLIKMNQLLLKEKLRQITTILCALPTFQQSAPAMYKCLSFFFLLSH